MARNRVNSLDSFRKQSPRLVLEQYDHCEVPAGCGGAVLRWRNPRVSLCVLLHLFTPTEHFVAQIDDQPVHSVRLDLAPGPHLLTIVLNDLPAQEPALALALEYPVNDAPKHHVVTKADQSWKYSLSAPSEEWRSPDFDDSSWPALVAAPTRRLESSDSWRLQQCTQRRAITLGVAPADCKKRWSVWIRKRFDILQLHEDK